MDSEPVLCRGEMSAHCQFFVTRKKRFCKMTVKKGKKYCGEHQSEEVNPTDKSQRMICPNDPKHTCYVDQLERHLKKCNAKATDSPEYIVPGINKFTASLDFRKPLTLSEIKDEDLLRLIGRIEAISNDFIPPISEEIFQHSALADELEKTEYGPSTRKHRVQNASLLGHIVNSGLLRGDTCFVEFGAGRGQLSFWLGKVVCDYEHCLLLLVDRASHRHKFDKQHANNPKVNILRLRADIENLCLAKLVAIQEYKHRVALTKHLCGSATDLALRCLTADVNKRSTTGVVMAPCCHHRANWDLYVGQEFLLAHGVGQTDFEVMCGIASWATCGKPKEDRKQVQGNRTQSDRYVQLNLNLECREAIGRKCKQVLDYGRLKYLENTGFECKLVEYINREISPENLCIIGVRSTSDQQNEV